MKVYVKYNGLVAFEELNITLEAGDRFGFICPNGTGKTTTIKILATLLKPSRGEAIIAGYSILKKQWEVRRVIGYVPDCFGMYEELKIYAYLKFFSLCYKLHRTKIKDRIDEVLTIVK